MGGFLVALMLLLIAGAVLLHCWCPNIMRIMIDGDMVCIGGVFMMLET